jgi:hypothetical protein
MMGIDPGYRQRGPYEASEGITLVAGKEKLGMGRSTKQLDRPFSNLLKRFYRW